MTSVSPPFLHPSPRQKGWAKVLGQSARTKVKEQLEQKLGKGNAKSKDMTEAMKEFAVENGIVTRVEVRQREMEMQCKQVQTGFRAVAIREAKRKAKAKHVAANEDHASDGRVQHLEGKGKTKLSMEEPVSCLLPPAPYSVAPPWEQGMGATSYGTAFTTTDPSLAYSSGNHSPGYWVPINDEAAASSLPLPHFPLTSSGVYPSLAHLNPAHTQDAQHGHPAFTPSQPEEEGSERAFADGVHFPSPLRFPFDAKLEDHSGYKYNYLGANDDFFYPFAGD